MVLRAGISLTVRPVVGLLSPISQRQSPGQRVGTHMRMTMAVAAAALQTHIQRTIDSDLEVRGNVTTGSATSLRRCLYITTNPVSPVVSIYHYKPYRTAGLVQLVQGSPMSGP